MSTPSTCAYHFSRIDGAHIKNPHLLFSLFASTCWFLAREVGWWKLCTSDVFQHLTCSHIFASSHILTSSHLHLVTFNIFSHLAHALQSHILTSSHILTPSHLLKSAALFTYKGRRASSRAFKFMVCNLIFVSDAHDQLSLWWEML